MLKELVALTNEARMEFASPAERSRKLKDVVANGHSSSVDVK
jgi:hypothetical protein